MKKTIFLVTTLLSLLGCKDTTTGQACLGANNDSLVENIQDQCKAGDAIATKHPVYFCDFNYSIAYNDYNSAMCIYSGKKKVERTTGK